MKGTIKDKNNLLEEQARRIDGLSCDLKSLQVKHEGHVHRMQERQRQEIVDVKERAMQDICEIEIKLQSSEELVEELKRTTFAKNDGGEAAYLRVEVA